MNETIRDISWVRKQFILIQIIFFNLIIRSNVYSTKLKNYIEIFTQFKSESFFEEFIIIITIIWILWLGLTNAVLHVSWSVVVPRLLVYS